MKLRSISTFYVYSSVSLERREKNQKLENEVRELKSTITGVNIAEINMLKQKRIPKKIRGALLCWTRFTTK
jgi:hypothetical protein